MGVAAAESIGLDAVTVLAMSAVALSGATVTR
jgi:hypothetical protein